MRLFMIRGIIGTGAPSEMPLEATDKQSCMLLDPMKASRLSPQTTVSLRADSLHPRTRSSNESFSHRPKATTRYTQRP